MVYQHRNSLRLSKLKGLIPKTRPMKPSAFWPFHLFLTHQKKAQKNQRVNKKKPKEQCPESSGAIASAPSTADIPPWFPPSWPIPRVARDTPKPWALVATVPASNPDLPPLLARWRYPTQAQGRQRPCPVGPPGQKRGKLVEEYYCRHFRDSSASAVGWVHIHQLRTGGVLFAGRSRMISANIWKNTSPISFKENLRANNQDSHNPHHQKKLPANGSFPKWWYSQIIHFNRIFHYKPSSYWGNPISGNLHVLLILHRFFPTSVPSPGPFSCANSPGFSSKPSLPAPSSRLRGRWVAGVVVTRPGHGRPPFNLATFGKGP